MNFELHNGDCLEVMAKMPDASVDAVVTDPPYGLSFMGKRWDYDVPSVEIWREVLRVLKPGGHLLSFGGTRTYHRMVVNIEDAGFEIRDQIQWIYGSGFPKSLDVSKAMDKAAGAEREVVGVADGRGAYDGSSRVIAASTSNGYGFDQKGGVSITAPATEAAKQWEGWGTALKPANEPICLARKPLIGTVAENVRAHGTGALNIDGCRVGSDTERGDRYNGKPPLGGKQNGSATFGNRTEAWEVPAGRFPANIIHDGSDEVVGLFPQSQAAGRFPSNSGGIGTATGIYGKASGREQTERNLDSGSAARFFYCAKASKADRDAGLDGFEQREVPKMDGGDFVNPMMGSDSKRTLRRNVHPTVKPTDLMRYLCRLITPPNGTVLDPFAGSGSTGKAAMLEGFNFIGIEREKEYAEIAKARIEQARDKGALFATV